MDKPMLSLPAYRRASHAIDVLERIAQRETLRLGLAWTDLSYAQRNQFMNTAAKALDHALFFLWREPLTAESGIIPAEAVRTYGELDRVEYWTGCCYRQCLERAQRLRHYRDTIEGRDR